MNLSNPSIPDTSLQFTAYSVQRLLFRTIDGIISPYSEYGKEVNRARDGRTDKRVRGLLDAGRGCRGIATQAGYSDEVDTSEKASSLQSGRLLAHRQGRVRTVHEDSEEYSVRPGKLTDSLSATGRPALDDCNPIKASLVSSCCLFSLYHDTQRETTRNNAVQRAIHATGGSRKRAVA